MNSSAFIKKAFVAGFVATLFSPIISAEPQNRHRSQRVLEQNADERYVVVTGSYIPQKVKAKSIGTDSVHNVRIFNHAELQSTGRQTLGEALTLDPSIQLTGRH